MARKRIGNQIPTKSLFLPYEKSEYRKAIELYEKSGREPYEWQAELLKPMLALNSDGLYTHPKMGLTVPRRNGKNEIIIVREIYGLENKQKIMHTAHRTMTSHSAWERLRDVLLECGYVENKDFTSLKAVGRERIEFASGGRVEFRTRTSTGGLGEGFDLLIIDEAQEYTEDQESALKYIVSDSDNPQTVFCGTPPTPVSAGTVFMALRNDVLDGTSEDTAWAEWSIDEIPDDIRDKELWYLTNPSLGLKLTERAIRAEIGPDETDFCIQRLGLWLKYNQKSAISRNDWDALKVGTVPELTGKLYVGIKYGNDGANVALSIASETTEGNVFIEAIDCQSVRNGNGWIIDFLTKTNGSVEKIVIDGASGQKLLADEIKAAGIRKKPILPTVKEIIVANSAWEQAIFGQTLKHMGQPSLREVATNCEKRNIGSGGGFGYRSQLEDFDIALMDSAMLAHWLCSEKKPTVIQEVRY